MMGNGREKGGTSASGEQSWRELDGARARRPINSPKARKRRRVKWLKVFVCLLLVFAVGAGSVWGIMALKNREDALQVTPASKPIERIVFSTNGVLPESWWQSVVDVRVGMPMMEIDIYELKQTLEFEGQVASASVERVFPGELRISIEELRPVMRLAIMDEAGKQVTRIVANDGTVYDGIGYLRAALHNLPYVQPYRHPEGGYFPLRGIERVTELLELMRRVEPKFFRTWQVVSLEHYSGDLELPGQVIEVRSTMVPRILFSASVDYVRQLERLKHVFKHVQEHGNPSIERIDLSLLNSAAVQFSSGRIGTY